MQILEYLCLATENATLVEELQARLHHALSVNGFSSNPWQLYWPLVFLEQVKQIHHQHLLELQCSGMVDAVRMVIIESGDLHEIKTYILPPGNLFYICILF